MITETAHDVFWLARYAHNTLDPLLRQARELEPSLSFGIEMLFNTEACPFTKTHHLIINSHWNRGGMFIQTTTIRTPEQIDALAGKVGDWIAAGCPALARSL